MGNLFCKQTSIPATSDVSMAIDPTGTNFLQELKMIWQNIGIKYLLGEIVPCCRKLVPVGSIAVDKSLVAGIEVCLQNKLPIIKA